MADDVVLNAGSGGDSIGADEIAGVKYQRVKLILGANNTNDGDVASGNPLPVTGTVAVTNAGITTIAGAVSGSEMQVDVVTSALPTGAAIAAKQPDFGTAGTASVNVLSVQGIASMTPIQIADNGGAITVDGTVAVTSAGITTIAGAVSGTEMQVDVVAALPAGTNAIGKLAANSGVDIGDVDVTSVTPGTAAASLGKAEDAAHTSGDVGVMALAVRLDSGAAIAGTDGDYSPLQVDASGALRVTGGGGGTEYTEDAASAADPVGNAVILVRADTPAATVSANGDNIAQRGTDYGAAYVTLLDSGGSPVSVGGGTQYTEDAAAAANPVGNALMLVREDALAGSLTSADGDNVAARGNNKGELYVKHTDTLAVTQSGTWDEVGINDSGNSITVDNPALSVTGGGVEATALRVTIASDSTGVVSIDDNGGAITVDGTVAVTNGGTFAVQVDGSALTALQLIDDPVSVLGTATYAEAATKGMIIGAVRRDADTTLVDTTNEIAPLQVDANGRLKVEAFSGETLPVSLTSTTVTGTVAVTQSGTWDEVGINDSGNSITVDAPVGTPVFVRLSDGSSAIATLPVSLASVPSHAVTNAGTFAVQESATAASRGIYVEDAAETAGGNLVMAGAVRRDTAASSSGTTGDNSTINVDALGKLWTTGSYAEDAAHTAGDTLTAIAARRIDTPAVSSGTSGDYSTVDVSAEGAVWTTNTPTTTGGCSIFRSLDIDETEEDVKTSAGNLYGYFFGNVASSVRYLKFYNATAANVTVGSTTPVLTFPLPATSSGHIGFSFPVGFATAISVACTTGVADADTGAPSANDVIINVFYK